MNTMIKPTYLIIGAALLLSACAQDDIPCVNQDGDRRIIFHTSLPGITSRAMEIVTDINYFNLTAFNPADTALTAADGSLSAYIDNEYIEKEAGQNVLTSDKCIWPEPGKDGNMSFFAYYPSLDNGAQPVNASKISGTDTIIDYRIKDFRVAHEIADQMDFVSAYTTGSMAENLFSGITLNFGHQLSRIEVNAWGANKSCDIEIAGVRIGGVNVEGTLDFNPAEGASAWSGQKKGTVEHIFSQNEELVILSLKNGSHATSETATSIMGENLLDENNCAMVIPTADETGWKYGTDYYNEEQKMYISVLLRVIDKTPGGKDKQQYPYYDNSQGLNAMNIDRVYLAVDASGKIAAPGQVYMGVDSIYYTDKENTEAYNIPQGSTVKEFGWAALPVTANWEPGYVYTYTLDYSNGVGLHDPEVTGESAPIAGDPIISDKVGITVSVNYWQGLDGSTTSTVVVPGS